MEQFRIATFGRYASVVVFAWLRVASAIACNGPPPPSAIDALKAANLVIVADLISTEQHPSPGDISGRVITEDATFKILEVFKGTYRVGDVIHIVSTIGPGPCGMSAKNSPAAIESVGKDHKTDVPVLSGRWLIYGYGSEPYELNMMTRTKPMEFGGDTETNELRRVLERSATDQSGACLHYGRPHVSIEGRITNVKSVNSVGTPDDHWYIDTVAPVCVSADDHFHDLEVPNTRHIEFFPPHIGNLGALDGQYVRLTGEFMHTYIPHYHAYPIFQVSSMEQRRATAP